MVTGTTALVATLAVAAIGPAVAAAAVVFDAMPAMDTNQISATFRFHDSSGSGNVRLQAGFGQLQRVHIPGQPLESVRGRARVLGGGRRPVPVSRRRTAHNWKVDLTPPTTQVTGHPPTLTNSTTATFTFTSPDTTATFRCSLNGAAPQGCTSPVVYSGLADGTRSLLIQAVDPAGNVDTQAQPISWTVDTTPPDTVLANPGNLVAQEVAVFSFTSTEAGSTFECAFGSAAFSACTPPDAVDVPGSGAQVFKVRAIDGAGNVDPTPAVYQWTTDLTPPKRPKVTIFADPVASASGSRRCRWPREIPGSG